MREQQMVKVHGITAQADIFRCDGECRKLLDPTRKPMIVAQHSFILQHPDGFNEVIHVSNEAGGRFRYYCLECFYRAKGCDATKDEHAKCMAALKRRTADLLALKEQAQLQEWNAKAAKRTPKGKAKPN